jgi:hypothetical protein
MLSMLQATRVTISSPGDDAHRFPAFGGLLMSTPVWLDGDAAGPQNAHRPRGHGCVPPACELLPLTVHAHGKG